MSAKLDNAMRIVAGHLDRIGREVFKPGMRLTFIARDPEDSEADFFLSDDDLPGVVALLARTVKRDAQSSKDTPDNLPPLPEPFATLHHDDGYFTMPARDQHEGRVFQTKVITLDQARTYGQQCAQAAIAAERGRQAPAGWCMVPVEPTQEMRRAGQHAEMHIERELPYSAAWTVIWPAMLSAAPEAPRPQEGETLT